MVRVRLTPGWQLARGKSRRSVLLVIIFVAAFIDVALLAAFAMVPQTRMDSTAPRKLQRRLATAPISTSPVQMSSFSEPRPAIGPDVLPSESAPLPAQVSNRISISPSETDMQPVSKPDAKIAPQSGNRLQSDTMPLPTRKPERPTVKKALSSRTVLKRTIQRQVVQKPKSIQFGSFGYPYTGSAE
jgi:hypothetical protein